MTNNQDVNKTIENFTYNLNDLIGKGAFSSVYLGKCDITGEAVAIKVINLGSLTMETYQKLQKQLAILNSLPHHPNIVKMLKALQTVNNVYIITEHCENKLKKSEIFNNATIAFGIIQGLKHLYKNNIVHRDLKPDNILVKNGVAKIIDFGFAKTLSNPLEVMNQHLGTPLFMSPQMFDKQPYTSKSDIWSLGVTLHELIYKCDPYQAKDIQDLRRKIKTVKPAISMMNTVDPLINIIKKCLTVDQNQRISWQQLFSLSQQLKRSSQDDITTNMNRQVITNSNIPFIPRGIQSRVPLVYY